MSAYEIAKKTIQRIELGADDVIMLNFANADMVAHTGVLSATVAACEAVDECLGQIADHVLAKGGVFLVTADHGNAEEIINVRTGDTDKEHSTNPVPFLIIGSAYQGMAGSSGDPPEGDLSLLRPVGVLADVAPTMLKILEIEQPEEMAGRALI